MVVSGNLGEEFKGIERKRCYKCNLEKFIIDFFGIIEIYCYKFYMFYVFL